MSDSGIESDQSSQLAPGLQEMARDYTDYLHVNASKERQAFYNSVEELLIKLDDFGGLVDVIRSDTSLCLDKTTPNIQAKCEEMKELFTKVDQLESFVKVVRENVRVMEERVDQAENDMGTFSLKKMFTSLVGTKKPTQSRQEFDPPEIFFTEEYIRPLPRSRQLEVDCPAGRADTSQTVESGLDSTTNTDDTKAVDES